MKKVKHYIKNHTNSEGLLKSNLTNPFDTRDNKYIIDSFEINYILYSLYIKFFCWGRWGCSYFFKHIKSFGNIHIYYPKTIPTLNFLIEL